MYPVTLPFASKLENCSRSSLNLETIVFTRCLTRSVRLLVGIVDNNSSIKSLSWISMPYLCSDRLTSLRISKSTSSPNTMSFALKTKSFMVSLKFGSILGLSGTMMAISPFGMDSIEAVLEESKLGISPSSDKSSFIFLKLPLMDLGISRNTIFSIGHMRGTPLYSKFK